jgi:L-ascorbate metabolism protein UlaG (beta-lactamase superfamily)
MKRVLISIILLFAVIVSSAASDQDGNAPQHGDSQEPGIKIKWLGHASFQMTTSQGKTIITDPINFKGHHMPAGTTADIITVSHEHPDHNSVDAVGGTPVVLRGTDQNLSAVNDIDTTIGDVRLYTLSSYHDPGHFGHNAIFVFEFDGIRVAHLGDLGTVLTDDQADEIGEIDILMIPVGGQFTIASAEADTIVNHLNVKRLILPMHYRTEAFDAMPYTVEPFLEGKDNVKRVAGNEITLDPEASQPVREIVVLEY